MADVVLGVAGADTPTAIAIVEVQLQRDDGKRLVWPHYATSLWRRYACPIVLCVVALAEDVRRWASRPIEFGPGNAFAPIVLGREAVPLVLSVAEGQRSPELAVLSALAHREGPRAVEVAARRIRPVRRGAKAIRTALRAQVIGSSELPEAVANWLSGVTSPWRVTCSEAALT